MRIPTLDEVRAERARRGLLAFTTYTMPTYEVGWHHRVVCEALDRLVSGEITRLMISMPPRHGKSELVSRRLPAYVLGRDPDAQIIASSYSADLASMMNRDVQRIMDSPEYARAFPGTRLGSATGRSLAGGTLRNSDVFEVQGRRGRYRSAGVGGGITGMGATIGIIDDPFKNREEADSPTMREKVWDWYTSTFYTRLEKGARVLVTFTRWHEDDLGGRLLRLQDEDPEADRWVEIRLPAIAEEPIAAVDPRKVGEALWPTKYSETTLSTMRATVGSRDWAALYQQRPAPDEGGIFKREWIRYWTEGADASVLHLPEGKERRADTGTLERFLTVDLAASAKQTADYTVASMWAVTKERDLILLDRERVRFEGPDQGPLIERMHARWNCDWIGIEAVAYQMTLVQTLARKGLPVRPLRPDKDKVSRALTAAARMELGTVYLPKSAPWLSEFEAELLTFPNAAHDDQVDTLSYAAAHVARQPKPSTLRAPVAAPRSPSWRGA